MRYEISGHNFGDVSISRRTAAEAISRAAELIGGGIRDVTITDTETGRSYEDTEFTLLLRRP
jgi:hypothetical protein